MNGLGETTEMLARLRRSLDQAGLGHAGLGPLGLGATPAGFGEPRVMAETRDFGPNPGQLRMLSYVPDDLGPDAPLVVALHGCGQAAEDYATQAGWLALARRRGFAVLAPQQSNANNPNRCFNWFDGHDVVRGGGEVASIAAMVQVLARERGLDGTRVFVTGLSAGGAMALALLATYPELFAGGAVIAGLPYGVASNISEAIRAMHGVDERSGAALAALVPVASREGSPAPRLAIWHGTADRTVNPANAAAIARQWAVAHGLSETPDGASSDESLSRSVWRGRAGEGIAIELNLVKGLGHGAPLATQGPQGLGAVGPFMLEAGVSSSLEIADFWGLRERARRHVSVVSPAAPPPPQPRKSAGAPPPRSAETLGELVMSKVSSHVPASVRDVIAKAMKSAGLMS